MPTVIVSAAPDVDSAEEGSDTSADDADALSSGFRSAFGTELELGPSVLAHDDLPGQITRLLGKSEFNSSKNDFTSDLSNF